MHHLDIDAALSDIEQNSPWSASAMWNPSSWPQPQHRLQASSQQHEALTDWLGIEAALRNVCLPSRASCCCLRRLPLCCLLQAAGPSQLQDFFRLTQMAASLLILWPQLAMLQRLSAWSLETGNQWQTACQPFTVHRMKPILLQMIEMRQAAEDPKPCSACIDRLYGPY